MSIKENLLEFLKPVFSRFVVKQTGKDLSTNDYTDEEKAKNVQPDWEARTGYGVILNKPYLSPVALSGDYNDLYNLPIEMKDGLMATKAFTEEETIEGFVYKDNGAVVSTTTYRSTDFVPLPLGHVGDITVKSTINGNCALAFFDENGTAILIISEDNIADYGYSTYPTSQERTFAVPDGAVYMRISAKTTSNPIEDELSFRIRIDISNLALEAGNISAALDGIIAIQNSLIGGAVV